MFDVWCGSRGVREGFVVPCLYRGTGVLEVGSEETVHQGDELTVDTSLASQTLTWEERVL